MICRSFVFLWKIVQGVWQYCFDGRKGEQFDHVLYIQIKWTGKTVVVWYIFYKPLHTCTYACVLLLVPHHENPIHSCCQNLTLLLFPLLQKRSVIPSTKPSRNNNSRTWTTTTAEHLNSLFVTANKKEEKIPKEIPRKKDENRRILLMLRVRYATALESSAIIFFWKSALQKIRESVVRRRSFFPKSLHSTMGWALFVRFFKVGSAYPGWGCLHTQRKVSSFFLTKSSRSEMSINHGRRKHARTRLPTKLKEIRKKKKRKKSFITPARYSQQSENRVSLLCHILPR